MDRTGLRRWTAEEKRQIVEETRARGSSVSLVARRHEINANLLFKWKRQAEAGAPDSGRGVRIAVWLDPRCSNAGSVICQDGAVLAGDTHHDVGAFRDLEHLPPLGATRVDVPIVVARRITRPPIPPRNTPEEHATAVPRAQPAATSEEAARLSTVPSTKRR